MAQKVKAAAKDEIDQITSLAKEATTSRAYLYPIKGIFYFLSHRSLQKPLTSKLAPTLTMGVAVVVGMFALTYLPQAAVMALFEGPLAPFSTVLLVLNESSTLFNALSKYFLIQDTLVDVFDGVLVEKGLDGLVSEGRVVQTGRMQKMGDSMDRLGRMVKRPFVKFTPQAIIRYFLYLPLNLIPGVGTFLFIVLQGKRAGPTSHDRYFQLKGIGSGRKRNEFVERRRGAYTSFGVVAVVLELVPIAGIFFAFTNTVGAAIWAADIEKDERARQDDSEMDSSIKGE